MRLCQGIHVIFLPSPHLRHLRFRECGACSIAMQWHSSAGVSIKQHRAHLRWWRLAAQQRLPWHLPSSTSRHAGSGGQALLAPTLLLLLLALHHASPCCLLSPHLTHYLTTRHRLRAHHPLRQRRQPHLHPPPTMSARKGKERKGGPSFYSHQRPLGLLARPHLRGR